MTFLWSDAWILQAVAVASRGEAAPLADVIAAADAVKHQRLEAAMGRMEGGHGIHTENERLLLVDSTGAAVELEQRGHQVNAVLETIVG